eukprot:416331_1
MYTSWSYRLQTSMMLLIISSFISQINAQNMSSYFECKTSNECNYDMHCIDGQDCSVTCISEGSCAHGVIYPPNSGNLTVTCGPNAYTCLGMTLRGPRNGSFALSCNGHETCRWVSVICPIFGDCMVVAPTYTARNIDMIIDGRNMTSGKLHVVDLQESTVHCPRNYLECVADCITAPCTGTSFHTKDDSILRIFASGASSLQNVNVYCALNAINPPLIQPVLPQMIPPLSCSISVDCGAQGSGLCNIELPTGPSYDEWQCKVSGSNHSINFTDLICVTVDPTSAPSDDPTLDPTTPTDAPTADPTIKPTADPTGAPSDDPTTDPTDAPTADPTIKPTADPTAAPSDDPSIKPTIVPTAVPYGTPLNTATEIISITITCGGNDCHFDEDTVDVINNIKI